ncbi:Transcriptional regulator AsnC family [Patulibacter medicamentivorans]|uniref:Transcriptional regulator AsnC family n=1 Tax=Patulibacter medicamentivorans TaxID=1097667 RepID=H0EAQ7_9ACTN|nr:Lrp/AsnC ligand binding domain-containing protein [Patulibacter medicamentivorans]EHN09232.1 Transcriptional regulator AsnC family [Patulibacter medicamentivorans]
MAVATAIVLVQANRVALGDLGERLAEVDGVGEAYSVTGDWDFVAIVRVPQHEQLAEVVTGRISKLEGVERTQTLVAFEAFSRHDLDALFDVGG